MKKLKRLTTVLPHSLLLINLFACQIATPTATPTATSTPPEAPYIVEWSFSCDARGLTFTVKWLDNARNETGYRVFRNHEKLVELPPNSTTYTDTFMPPSDQRITYYLQVYGPTGSANSYMMRMNC